MALNNLACVYADHLNQLEKAYPLARRARDVSPSDPSVADTLGWILYRRGEYTPALVLLRESAAKLYSIPVIQFHLGMACYMDGLESEAKTAFQRALSLNGSFLEKDDCQRHLAIINIDPDRAGADTRAWLEKWTKNYPNDPVALARLAAIYQSKGMTDKALGTDQAILNANPQNVFALENMAELYASADPQKACAFAKSAYEASPGNPGIVHLYGRLAFKTGDYSWSLTLLQLAAQSRPHDPNVLFDLGQALYSEGKVSAAQTFAQKALQSDSNFTRADDARRFLAMTDLADNVVRASATQVDQILSASPGYVPALMVKAAICAEKSDTSIALQTYRQILNIYPDFAPAKKELALLYADNPVDDTEGYRVAVQARQAFPNDPYVAKSLAMIVCRQGDYARAAGLLQESAHRLNNDPQLLYYLGLAQFHLNNVPASKANLQRALALDLSGQDAVDARRMLAELK
jgi:tetratricopeptide (TPR) repeat protein